MGPFQKGTHTHVYIDVDEAASPRWALGDRVYDQRGEECGKLADGLKHGYYAPVADLPRSPGDPAFDGAEESLRPVLAVTTPGTFLAGLTSAQRKEVPLKKGLFDYFPDALALVARHSYRSNEKHNPGQPLHWSRHKSSDHDDCILRHVMGFGLIDDGAPNELGAAWRALAALQLDYEAHPEKYK